ncbi:MAG TPA: mannitol dehydrogenase family protein [Rhizomicrobium sp.]|jgi:mannitol 2-dehydrogenase|nr:mannitol dehydrogenase family protein [Rhizomicrobium sp.]
MMSLTRKTALSLPGDVAAPRYDVRAITPGIVHIGLGGFHRSHLARYVHDLMEIDPGALRWGIVGSGLRESDGPLLRALERQDGLFSLVERDAEGETRSMIGSIVRVIDASVSTSQLLEAIAQPRIRIVSITVSQAGYHLDPASKKLAFDTAAIRHDIANPRAPRTMPGVLVEALRQRRDVGLPAFTALSCDNIQQNGRVLRDAVVALAEQSDAGLASWIAAHARFPSSMVDRITPVPTRQQIDAFSAATGIADDAVVFSERFRQWVIEDDFASGRPDWSKVDAQFVSDVAPYEAMKLRLLNASHLAIAGLGALLGHETVEQTMRDDAVRRYMRRLMDEEIGPLLAPVPGIDLARYKAALIARFANPAIRDTVRRINSDAPINLLLEPLRDALAAQAPISLLALALAAWCQRVRDEVQRGETVAGANANPQLQQRAADGGGDPAALLAVAVLFGDLGRDTRLMAALHGWLVAFKAGGVRSALRQL